MLSFNLIREADFEEQIYFRVDISPRETGHPNHLVLKCYKIYEYAIEISF